MNTFADYVNTLRIIRDVDKLNGFDLGMIVTANEAEGLEAGFAVYARHIRGMQLSVWASIADYVGGMQVSLRNECEIMNGAQAGALNVSKKVDGAQLGIANVSEKKKGIGIAGLADLVMGHLDGIQIAPVCYAKNGAYVQVGFITLRGIGPWYSRASPLFGFHKS